MKAKAKTAPKKRTEVTSARIAKIAGRMVRLKAPSQKLLFYFEESILQPTHFTIGDLKALAASALTQATDKPKAKK